jgi:Tfp pilus assembly protein PilP
MPYHTGTKPKPKIKSNPPKKKSNPKPKTLKEAIEKFDMMKNKPKANMKSTGTLSKRQKDLMKTHKEHHTRLHLQFMKYLMTKKNYCFEISHELTQKIVGK